MRFDRKICAALLAAGLFAAASPARAADLGPIFSAPDEAPVNQPFEFGTGWYLRGDAAFSDEAKPKLDLNRAQFDRNGTANGYSIGLGAGYKFNSFLRADLTGDYLDPYSYSIMASCGLNCSTTARSQIGRYDGLANGYIDLGHWGGFTPYVGAGAGFSVLEEHASGFSGTAVLTSRHTDMRFAWAAMAGVSYSITPNMLLDVGYRYLDLGRMNITLPNVATVQKDITAHQVRVGLRYVVD